MSPNGEETLVSLGTYALTPGQHGTITWQLFGGGWTFAAGHTIRLELLGSDLPYLRPSKSQTTLTISDTVVELPTHERPGDGQVVPPELADGHRRP